ncbi:MAG: hypothetical protein BroJett024_39200 [Alphaproteobacteria bacterium]|nr:MAG: hypothetical protein BroJett024_39200 [Alphaproteobacteria bacterium]
MTTTHRFFAWSAWFIAVSALSSAATLAGAQPVLEGLLDGHAVRPAPSSAPPGLHEPFVDPTFGTTVMRITDPSQVPGKRRIRHYYSKANPLNANDSLAIFFGGDGSLILYDAATWKPIRELDIVSSDPEIQWHPKDPGVFYFLDFAGNSPNVRAMYRYDTKSGKKTLLRDFSEYETVRGKLEGNLDREGRYYAMVGKKGANFEAFVYDLQNDTIRRRLPVTGAMVADWISVTPSGRHVVMMGKDRSRVFDLDMNHLRDLPLGTFGHADLCLRADGTEVMVFDGADHQLDNNRNINMADLQTGRISVLTRIGWGTTPHVSCRNLAMPGWALISTQGPDRKYPNHDFEIFWIKLDGSGQVRRVAHHHSSREKGGYFSEQHAVTNATGTRIIFASNWNGAIDPSSFLVTLPRSRGQGTSSAIRKP